MRRTVQATAIVAVILGSTGATASETDHDGSGTTTAAVIRSGELRSDLAASRSQGARSTIPGRLNPRSTPDPDGPASPEPELPGELPPAPAAVPVPAPTPEPTASAPAPTAPAPAPAPAPAAPPPAGQPGPGNTGVPAGTALTVHEGDLTIATPGAVVEGLDIHGFVRVTAPDVTIRNSIIRGGATTSAKGLLTATSDGASVTIEDSELAPTEPSPWIDGIRGWNITARRVNIHHVIDGFHLYGSTTTIESSWIHDHAHFQSDPQQGGSPSHDDSIQIQKGSGIRIVGNTISGAYNTGIQFTQDQGKVSDVTISQNWLDGGGCTVNLAEKGLGPFVGVVITDNTFGRNTRVRNCAIISPSTTTISVARNYFTDGTVAAVRDGD